MLGCDVSLATRRAYEEYATTKGIGVAMLWTAAKLEAMLYAEHPDLLFSFFGISLARHERTLEANLKRGLAMKRKLIRLLPHTGGHPDIIVRSIDDEAYPNADAEPKGRMSTWFKAEFGLHYHNGIEVILNIEMIIVDRETQHWAVVDYSDPEIKAAKPNPEAVIHNIHYEIIKVFTMGRIPFRNIFEIDDEGDEYYRGIHIYCRYADAGMPYEVILQREVDGYREYYPETQFPFTKRKRSDI